MREHQGFVRQGSPQSDKMHVFSGAPWDNLVCEVCGGSRSDMVKFLRTRRAYGDRRRQKGVPIVVRRQGGSYFCQEAPDTWQHISRGEWTSFVDPAP